ncbi:tRNA epoxyqueuosine(34) reductase QueG [Fuchsiella alkaliacetigena]|uniref:tRNA epoxyqueuosine(34) reductase QueG n=1 Tax=Fuchsiella alkaliacetigena TaxID=957042 RepID=UPI00200AFF64|nr:tRNA epoxyqueuosine(34) reductase QueG [Fuchsiella alkaliacetigena]MCK8823980.1 tRNA epoxyqueuosine(34) reductase QueG [Fuchsiella alkaliacetigena]
MSLAEEIKRYAKGIGIDEVKITTAASFPELKQFLEEVDSRGYLSRFVNRDFELITDPQKVLATAKSVIVCAISYYVEENNHLDDQPRGKLARFARIKDYHDLLGEKLDRLVEFLSSKAKGLEVKSFVDTGPAVDRALARRAGLGWQGKNCSIIHPEYGSWISIGGIISNLELEADAPLAEKCGDCRRCIEACPTGALKDAYTLDASRCLGYLTLSKGYIPENYRRQMGDRVWGCDSCQEVCPYNQQAKESRGRDFQLQHLETYPELKDLLKLSNQEFAEKFAETAMDWRGKRPLKRNAAIALGNFKEQGSIPILTKALDDPQAVVRGHVAWALGELGVARVVNSLEQRLAVEKDKQVQKELKKSIKRLS